MPAATSRVALPDRYRIVRHIANGGMAGVWAAEDSLLSRLVAVKVLGPAYAEEESARKRFMREARAGAKLGDHPNVVTVYDVGECEGLPFMVMEHFPGGSAADRLREGDPIPRPTAIRWLREAASALDHAHRHDVVHRDVKPANLLLDERGRLAVGDFGIATVASEASVTLTGQVLGTAAYISPEQAIGRPATPASDRYALAVVAWEMLTGHRPFPGETPAVQARAHVEAPVPLASTERAGLPPAVDAILERGLAKEPGERPGTARALVDQLEGALGGDAEPATAPTRLFLRGDGAAPAPTPTPAPAAPQRRSRRPEPLVAPARGGGVPPHDPHGRDDDRGRRRPGVWLAVLAAAALAIGAVAAILTTGGGNQRSASTAGSTTPRHSSSSSAAAAPKKHKPSAAAKPRKQSQQTSTQSTQTQQSQTQQSQTQMQQTQTQSTSSAPSASAKTDTAGALNDQGYAKLQAGDTAGALPLLQRSVDAYRAQGQTAGLGYAFALYNLAHALRLSGQPAAAIPYLQERLRVSDNQAGTVKDELKLARQQARKG